MKRVLTGLFALALLLTLSGALRAAEEHSAPVANETHGTAAAGHGATGGGHGGEADDEPALLSGPDRGLVSAITTLIVFSALLAVLGKYAWGPIAAGLKAREDKIRNDIADAEAANKAAKATLDQYNKQLATAEQQVRDILNKAAQDAEKMATSMKMQAQQDVEEIKERATKDIEGARKAALNDIYAQAADLSTTIASKILRRNLNADDQRELVNSSLEQFQTAGKA
jgi:F-type H+-transporting ATPase subunit b